MSIKAVGADEGLINFYRVESGQKPNTTTWQIKHLPVGSSTPGLSIGTPAATLLFIDNTTGNVGIGTQTPGFPLTIGNNTLGDKISLSGQSGNHYGFGIQSAQLQIHTDVAGADVVFGYGNSGSMTETMRIKGNGNVGIGTASPSAKLHIQASDNDALKITNPNFSKTARMGVDSTGVFIEPSENNSSLRLNANPSVIGLFVNGDGNVGIGTAAPRSKLHIHGNYLNDGRGGFALDATDNADPETYVLRINPFALGDSKVGYQFQTKSFVGGTNVPLTFDNIGNVGIGTTTPSAKLHVMGVVRALNFLTLSDAREKRDVADLDYGLKEITQLRPVSFNWKDIANPHKSMGLVAQEVMPILGEAVYRDEKGPDDHLSIAYTSLIPVLINAVKELAAKVQQLSGEITAKAG